MEIKPLIKQYEINNCGTTGVEAKYFKYLLPEV